VPSDVPHASPTPAAPERGGRPESDGAPAPRRGSAEIFRTLRHDLRTPINHIIGYSELLLEEAGDRNRAGLTPDLRKIHAAGRQLLALLNELLDPAKLDGGVSLELLSEGLRTPLNAVIGYSDLLREEAEERGWGAVLPDLAKIHAAGNRLLGLVTAAVDLSKVDAAAPTHPPATEPDAALAEVASVAAPQIDTRTAVPPVGSGTLLVVDDDEANRDMLSRRLGRLGYAVFTAESGSEALERLGGRPFDLVLLDIMMPGMDGYQVLKALKRDDALRHVPVIVLSSNDETSSAVRCIELGAEDYLPKPFDAVLLKARIGASLEKKRLRDREARYLAEIEAARKRSDELLHVILPREVIAELKGTDEVKPRRYEHVAVIFCDIAGFTAYCDRLPPHEVIPHLQHLIEAYEEIALRHELQKIKTIGDSFMAAAGLFTAVANPVLQCVRAGVEMIAVARAQSIGWDVRVGIHAGPLVAGVLGRRQYLFDLFGDTVNTAARMESLGAAGSITLTATAWAEVADRCVGESLGAVPVKGKGVLEMVRFDRFALS
jgi:adenylate cyclase